MSTVTSSTYVIETYPPLRFAVFTPALSANDAATISGSALQTATMSTSPMISLCRRNESAMIQCLVRGRSRELDPLENSLCRLWPELWQFSETTIERCSLEVLQCLDPKRFLDLMDFGATESRDLEQIVQSFWSGLAEAVEVAGLAGLDELANYGECCAADCFRFSKLARVEEWSEILSAELQYCA